MRHRVEGPMFVGLHCGYCLVSFESALCILLSQLLFTMCSNFLCNITFHVYGHLAEPLQTNACVTMRLVLY